MSTVPNIAKCQPRFVLYARAKGLREGDTWRTWEYTAWIGDMVSRYKRECGMSSTWAISDHDDFTQWIADQICSNGTSSNI